MSEDMKNDELRYLRTKLKSGEFDGVDVMSAWIAIDELIALREWRDDAFNAHPNLDIDIEFYKQCQT